MRGLEGDDPQGRVACGETGRASVGPDLELDPGRGRWGVVAAGDIEDATDRAGRVWPQVAQGEVDGRPSNLPLGFGDDVGAVAVAALTPDPGEQGGAGRFDQPDAGAQADAGAPGPVLNKDIKTAGERTHGGEGQLLAGGLVLQHHQPEQRAEATHGAQRVKCLQGAPEKTDRKARISRF